MIALALAGVCLQSPVAAKPAGAEWLGFNGSYSADRFSPLKEITTRNVKSLRQVASYQLPETTSFQAGPVMVGTGRAFTVTA